MEDELLYRIAYMYYVREMTLEEIGDELRSLHTQLLPPPKIPNYKKPPQYPPATISKNLRRARERGIVRFVVDPPPLAKLENELRERYTLKNAVIVATPPWPSSHETETQHELRRQLGRAAAGYVLDHLSNGAHLGLCGGVTMAWFAKSLDSDRITHLDVHALAASCYERLEYAASTVVGLAVLNLKEGKGADVEICGHGTLVPLIESNKTSEAHERARAQIQEARQKCQMVLAGIGGMTSESSCVLRGQPKHEAETLRQGLERLGAVGDFLYQLFDKKCVPVKCDLNEQVVGLPLAELPAMAKEKKIIIAVAGGKEKLVAVRAVLSAQTRFLTCLVTDSETARALCRD